VEMTPQEFVAALAQRGVKLNSIGGRYFRAVTHYGIEARDIEVALQAIGDVMQ